MPLLPLAQLEFAGELPIEDGRYLVRPGGEPDASPDVLSVRTLGAERARPRLARRKKAKPVDPEASPGPLRVARVTLIKSKPFEREGAAADWLAEVAASEEVSAGLAEETARTLNRAIQAHRISAPDPYAADLHHGAAAMIRFGYGTGEEVAEGRWSEAVEMTEARRRSMLAARRADIGPQERVAAVLGGREPPLPHEELLAAARRALAEQREAEAATLLEAAARSHLRSHPGGRGPEVARELIAALPNPESTPPSREALGKLLGRYSAAIRDQ